MEWEYLPFGLQNFEQVIYVMLAFLFSFYCVSTESVFLGDRILSVNGTSLNQATHDEAAGILRNATGEIKIIASQFKSQGTSFLGELLYFFFVSCSSIHVTPGQFFTFVLYYIYIL